MEWTPFDANLNITVKVYHDSYGNAFSLFSLKGEYVEPPFLSLSPNLQMFAKRNFSKDSFDKAFSMKIFLQ